MTNDEWRNHFALSFLLKLIIRPSRQILSSDPEVLEGRFSKGDSRWVEFLKYSIDRGEEAEACSPFFCLSNLEPELNRFYKIRTDRLRIPPVAGKTAQHILGNADSRISVKKKLIIATMGGMQQDLGPPLCKKSLNDYKKFQLMKFDLLPIIK